MRVLVGGGTTATRWRRRTARIWRRPSGGSFLVMSLAFFVMQCHLLLAKQHRLQEHLAPKVRRTVLRRNAVGLLPYAIATLAAILTPYLTLAVCALVAVSYALPSTTSDVYQ